MKLIYKRVLYFFVASVFFTTISCKQTTEDLKEENQHKKIKSQGINVTTALIKPVVFQKEIIANGKVEAKQKSVLHFKNAEALAKIHVRNGQSVSKGALLAVLNNSILANQLESANLEEAQTAQKVEEAKINHGASEKDAAIQKNLALKTGHLAAVNSKKNAEILYRQSILKAPFSGIIANIEKKEGSQISTSDAFCTIINPHNLEVSFLVLESEFPFLENKQNILLQNFGLETEEFSGFITEINPMVDKNGFILVKAKIIKPNRKLLDGMHVKVKIQKPIQDVIVIPKQALVLRSNREVVFTLKNGLAKWNYVDVFDENSETYAISKGLQKKDTIIISGNMNLSHDAVVNASFIEGE